MKRNEKIRKTGVRGLVAGAAVAAALCGCTVVSELGMGPAPEPPTLAADGTQVYRIPDTMSIDIPAGVTDAQALDVIEQTIRGTRPGERTNTWIAQWRIEDRDAGNKWIVAGLTTRNHYLRVCWRIENAKLVPDVPFSTNLKQNGTKIHRKVPQWINNLAPLFRERLYRLSRGEK